jgi:hypothetical protein
VRSTVRVFAPLALALIACTIAGSTVAATQPSPRTKLPGFRVAVSYSVQALAELNRRHETVIVAAYLSGSPGPGAPKKLISKEGDIGLGDTKKEVAPGTDADFPTVSLDTAALREVDQQAPSLLINVYSGRKSSPDNLLDCDIYEGALANVQGQIIPIHCTLIAEHR